MATEDGVYFLTDADARPGRAGPGGEVVSIVWNMAFTDRVMVVVKDCVVGGSGVRVQNPKVAVDCVPVRTTVSWRVMVISLLVKSDVQPWAQNCAMGRRELDARMGKTCAWRAERGRPGIRRLPV
jgi:hypothetical protein